MTNTLHRFGSAESFDDDFILFAMACKGSFQVMMLSTMCGHSKRILEDARTKVS